MRQRRLNDNPELQSFRSWLGDIRTKSRTQSRRMSYAPSAQILAARTRTDRCPLCRVAFHNVSQALESSQANTLWPEPDHRITLRSLVQKPMVYYGDKRVGRIALYSRTLNYEPDRHTSSLAHLKMLSASNLGFGMLRAVRREVFNRNWSMIPEFYNNLPIRSKIRLSRLFDIKTPEYYYYSTLPNVSPPQRIDLSFLREALRECEEGHSRKCGANLGVSDGQLPTDILLIDVVENRLVKISTSCQKYLALSYVWGSVPMFKTTQENLASLQEPGAFLHLRSQLPRILRDAMDLTHYLGHRYLWCDALCIVQNDIQFKHSQIAKMSLIYGQAFLTICALSSSDAGVGLLGFSETLPGDMPQDTFGLTKTCAYVSMTPILEDISHLLPYEQRAWTVQERLLSKRCLLFTATHIYFHCQDGMSSSNAYGRRFSKMELGGSGYWDPLPKFWGNNGGSFGVKLYTILVEKYTLRNLSYPEDVIDAFTAISLSFESYYSTRIQKGIPEPVFLVVLCWLGKKALKRRKQVLDQPLHPSRVFPSWSWVGWEGPITFVNNQSFLDISEGEYQSYVSNFVLEEGEQLLKLNHKRYNQQHPDCCQTVIPVSLTRHQSVLHFMAYSIDSSLFRLGITKSSFQDAILYQIAEDEGQILSREQLLPEAPEAVSQSSQRLQGLQEESCCGCLQLNDLNLRSENGVINDCIYVLLSTMNVRFYNKEAWSCGFPWFDGGRNRDMNKWLLNAILLTEQNGVWVRIGIAIFTQEAWNNAGPQERYIQLA